MSILGKILQFCKFFTQPEQNKNKNVKKVTKIKGFLCIFFGFTYWQMYLFPILYTYMKKKNTIKQKNSKNDVDTNIYALVLQKDNSLKRVLISDFNKKSK